MDFRLHFSSQNALDFRVGLPKNGTPGTYVYDFADVLSSEDEAEFNQTIQSLNDTTPNSIVVVTHPDFCGEEPFEFATGVGEKWGVGDAQFDNGVVLAISPKTEERRGQVFIAVATALKGCSPMRRGQSDCSLTMK